MSESKFATAKTVISAVGSVAAAAMVARSVAHNYIPPELQHYLRNFINKFIISRKLTIVIHEFDGYRENQIYQAAHLYLSSRLSYNNNNNNNNISPTQIQRLNVTNHPTQNHIINVAMEVDQTFTDVFKGVSFTWYLAPDGSFTYGSSTESDQRSLELVFNRKHKDLALNEYLPFIIKQAETRKIEEKTVRIFTVDSSTRTWTSVSLDHPATFATLAMDTDVKETVINDLDRFVERREYYRKVGKAWKRGYLLYGPPGTGKSSLVAAIANYLNFDIFDLDLTTITSNSGLRRLLVATANRSILVVEDIDCSAELHDRADGTAVMGRGYYQQGFHEGQRVTLSGFLNFIDGLWSSCGDERIIIFTTNKKDKLDPALLRPGRMDVHIHMSYCTPCGFRLLACNYLGITEHELFEEIEDLMGKVEITPAEVAEQLLKDGDPDVALGGLVEFFDVKRKENEEAKAKAKKQEEMAAKEMEEKQQIQKNEIVEKLFY